MVSKCANPGYMRKRTGNCVLGLVIALLGPIALAQNRSADDAVKARHIIGLQDIKPNAKGVLTTRNGALQFDAGQAVAKVPIPLIEDIFTGSETTQGGGTMGGVAREAAMGAPYDTGAVLSLLMRTKVDVLTVAYRDPDGGLHGTIFALPKGHAAQVRAEFVKQGARSSASEEQKRVAAAPGPAQPASQPKKFSASAILIEPVEAGDVRVPAEFRVAIYEYLIEEVRRTELFPKVFRSGDHQADNIVDLVTLRTKLEKFKEGSQMERQITTVLGATKVDVSAKLSDRDGNALEDHKVEGKVRFLGENLGVTRDVAKHIAKLLRKDF